MLRPWSLSLLLLLLAAGSGCKKDQPPVPPPAEIPARSEPAPRSPGDSLRPNLSLTIYEDAINDLLQAVGPLDRSGHVGPKTGLTSYSLDVPPPVVEIRRDSAFLRTDVTVKALGTQYTTPAIGQAQVEYDPAKDELYLAIGKLTVDIHMKALGVAIKLDRVDVSGFFAPRIKLLGKLPLATDFDVKKPQTGKEPVRFAVTRHRITYLPGRVVLDMVVDFTPATAAQTSPLRTP